MTDKELLLKDLCARLPYGIKCHEDDVEYPFDIIGTTANNEEFIFSDGYERSLEQIKLYLRPMSSMTEEEKKEYNSYTYHVELGRLPFHEADMIDVNLIDEFADWLNAHHFDYRGLIDKGLALEAPEGMYNTMAKN